ncbi:MAG: addiction module protein [Pseudomonadota bacterium]
MSVNIKEILSLSVEERLRLVTTIWDSIAKDSNGLELTEEQKAELDRRLLDLAAKPDAGAPWPEVKARILGQQ